MTDPVEIVYGISGPIGYARRLGVVWTYPNAEARVSYLELPAPVDACHHCGAPSPGDVCRYCNTVHRATAPKRADGPRVSADGWTAEARATNEEFYEGFTMLVIAPDGARYADPRGPMRTRPTEQDLLAEIARIRGLMP